MTGSIKHPLELWAATSNQGKINEYKTLIDQSPIVNKFTLHSQKELPSYISPEETGSSFQENSFIKTVSFAKIKPRAWVFAEDSGIEVDGLSDTTNTVPGIYSARYAGPNSTDQENNLKVLERLEKKNTNIRKARFKAVISLISPQKKDSKESVVQYFSGTIEGTIALKESGEQGFGYDSIFIPVGEEKTLAQLGMSFKNNISHRKQAFEKMVQYFNKNLFF